MTDDQYLAAMTKFRVWHIPQVPMEPFFVEVPDTTTGKLLVKALADYDAFQFESGVKGDYCNANGLEGLNPETNEWEEVSDLLEQLEEERNANQSS